MGLVRTRWRYLVAAATLSSVACAADDGDGAGSEGRDSPAVGLAPLTAPALVVHAADPAALSIAVSQALYQWSPAALVVDAASATDVVEARQVGASLGVPTLLAGDPLTITAELERLSVDAVLAIGELPVALRDALEPQVDVVTDADDLPDTEPAAPVAGVVALVSRGDPVADGGVATLEAAGLPVVSVDGGDPRSSSAGRAALRKLAPAQIVAIGATGIFPAADTLHGLVRTAIAGVELPGGGQVLFPGRRLIALYGHPGDANLGVLGEQDPAASVERARQVAAEYDGLGSEPAVPAFEIITTVASSEAGPDGDYSLPSSLDHIRPFVDAAGAAGQYVVLDLQPGYTDFLTQARLYEELLVLPHVGLALDPEWRLAPGERHMVNIGQVSAAEVNEVGAWLAELTRSHSLPQKLFLLHQFRVDMLPDRQLVQTHPELALVVQMDGLGTQEMKLTTWSILLQGGPAGLRFGWKNFYDEDSPMRSPADTVALEPSPVLVSYQ